ncbi:MAG: adenylyltransferase/cytidyltransferase family protein, partial [Betaproteobacteria bacterium]
MNSAPEFESKLTPPQDLKARVAHLPRPIVFTNGVFDLLHRGHVTYLAQARALGNALIVALNDDASTRRLNKAPDRPINGLADRAAVIAALESVSLVTWF